MEGPSFVAKMLTLISRLKQGILERCSIIAYSLVRKQQLVDAKKSAGAKAVAVAKNNVRRRCGNSSSREESDEEVEAIKPPPPSSKMSKYVEHSIRLSDPNLYVADILQNICEARQQLHQHLSNERMSLAMDMNADAINELNRRRVANTISLVRRQAAGMNADRSSSRLFDVRSKSPSRVKCYVPHRRVVSTYEEPQPLPLTPRPSQIPLGKKSNTSIRKEKSVEKVPSSLKTCKSQTSNTSQQLPSSLKTCKSQTSNTSQQQLPSANKKTTTASSKKLSVIPTKTKNVKQLPKKQPEKVPAAKSSKTQSSAKTSRPQLPSIAKKTVTSRYSITTPVPKNNSNKKSILQKIPIIGGAKPKFSVKKNKPGAAAAPVAAPKPAPTPTPTPSVRDLSPRTQRSSISLIPLRKRSVTEANTE